MTKGYDYAHDPERRYKKCHCCDGDLSGLIIFLIVYPMIDGIVLFFTSGAWLIFLLVLSAIFFFLFLTNWASKHPSPKVRKVYHWVTGIMLVLCAIGLYIVFCRQDLVIKWMN